MMVRVGGWLLVGLLCVVPLVAESEKEHFETSLHATRAGKNHWYGKENGGFEKWTGVGIEKLGCEQCHGPTDANGEPYPDPYPGAGCIDCHATEGNAVPDGQCYGCHGRQKTEAVKLAIPDVHRDAGLRCKDCHGDEDIHGDGTRYDSILQPGAIRAACEECHAEDDLPTKHAEYDPHDGKLHCSACHTRSVISCYNCHFESQVEAHVKRPRQPIGGFVMLVNREKDGKVHTASFQSLTYRGRAFVAFAPYSAHTISKEGRGCAECHLDHEGAGTNVAIRQYNDTGQIRFARWNAEDRSLDWIQGVVPIPEDYRETLRMEFLTFTGDPATPAGKDNEKWTALGKDTWDGSQMLFASPLSREQMKKLGFRTRNSE
jgi:hypothetical protein